MTGGTFGGENGFAFGGADGATLGTVAQREATEAALASVEPRGFTFGGPGGALWSGRGEAGALWGLGPATADELLAQTDGFGLVLEPVPPVGESPERRLYTETGTESEAVGALDAISMPLEANAISGAKVDLAAAPSLYRTPLGSAVLGHGGQRLFSGRVEPVEGDAGNESVTLELLGPVSRLDSGGVDVSYAGISYRDALRRFYAEEVSPRTDGRVRGIVETPRMGVQQKTIPADSPFEASGTLKSVLDKLHKEAGLTYTVAHQSRGDGLIESFKPGTGTPRQRTWEPNQDSVTPKLDPSGYATDVVVEGALVGDGSGDRYQGRASVSDHEKRALAGGETILHQPAPDDELTSDGACQQRAESLLAEDRSNYQMSGSLDAPPAPVQPGRVYRVPSMDRAAPEPLTPVSLVLRQADYSFARGERSMSLSFESAQGIAGLLRRADRGARAGAWAARSGIDMDDGQRAQAYATQYPHNYPTGGN